MKVTLVAAPYDTRLFRIGENLGIKYLAAVLRAEGIDVSIIEPALENLCNEDVVARLLETPYDLIGFSVMFDEALPNVAAIVGQLRAASCQAHITAGGHVPSFNYRKIFELIPGIDTVVRFEAETTILELIRCMHKPGAWSSVRGIAYRSDGNVVCTSPRELVADLDSIPFPVRDQNSRHLGDPHFFVITSRGCPFVCTFCSIPAFYKTPPGAVWRTRSVSNVLAELDYLVTEHGATAISFLDDEFLVGKNGKRRALSLAEELAKRQLGLAWSFECRADDVSEDLFRALRDGGLRHVFIGIESGVQRVLDTFDKRTTVEQNRRAIATVRGLDLSLGVGFIMFDPYTAMAEIHENVHFLNEMRIGSYKAVANKVRVYAGTRMESQLADSGLLVDDGFSFSFKFKNSTAETAYALTRDYLEPLHATDQERKRMDFKIDNLALDHPGLQKIRTRMSEVESNANALLADLMTRIATFAENSVAAGRSTQFERELGERVEDGVADLSSMLVALDNEIETSR